MFACDFTCVFCCLVPFHGDCGDVCALLGLAPDQAGGWEGDGARFWELHLYFGGHAARSRGRGREGLRGEHPRVTASFTRA